MNAGKFNFARMEGLRRNALIVGGAGIAISAIGLAVNPVMFFRSYLLAFVYWISFPMGALAMLMLHHLTGGNWGFLIRRLLEAATRTLWFLAILYVPLLLGMSKLYLWAQPGGGANPDVAPKHFYLNVPFFLVRSVIYFGVWLLLVTLFNRWSLEQDRTGDQRYTDKLAGFAGPGIVIYGLTISFAAIDWVMSLEPSWYSTIYGMVIIVAQVLVALSFVVLMARKLSGAEPLASIATPVRFNDLGNLMLTFVMLWAYLSFSQFLIIWSGNLPDEISWYMSRAKGSWAALAVVLILFHFAVPFCMLLSRAVKRHGAMNFVAALLLVLTLLDFYWLIVPAFSPSGISVRWTDLTLLVGMGGIWLWLFLGELAKRALVPEHDPGYIEALEHVEEHF
jgi:hypothetical protein